MKLNNGNTLIQANTFTAKLGNIKGRFDLYQSMAEHGVYHLCKHDDKQRLEQFIQAFVGVSGKVIGDGRLVVAYVNAHCYGFKAEADGTVTIENKKNGKAKPRGFKGYNDQNDLSWKAGGHTLGMAMSFVAWQTEQAKRKAAKAAERAKAEAEAEAKAEAAEQAKRKADANNADANNADESADDTYQPDMSRAGDIAEALRSILQAFEGGTTKDVEALAEAKAEADKLSHALAQRMAEAQAEADAPAQPEVQPEAKPKAKAKRKAA